MECPFCLANIPDGVELCPECGETIPATEPRWLERISQSVLRWMSEDLQNIDRWVQAQQHNSPSASPRQIAEAAVDSARFWSGSVGFVAGLGDLLGPLGFGAGTAVDVYYAAKLSIEMGQRIYRAYGHNIDSDEIKLRILAALGGGAAGLGQAAGQSTNHVAKRLVMRYLRGALLKAIKAFLRRLGIVFTRKALLAALPVVGSGVNLAVNRYLMGKLGETLLADAASQ